MTMVNLFLDDDLVQGLRSRSPDAEDSVLCFRRFMGKVTGQAYIDKAGLGIASAGLGWIAPDW